MYGIVIDEELTSSGRLKKSIHRLVKKSKKSNKSKKLKKVLKSQKIKCPIRMLFIFNLDNFL